MNQPHFHNAAKRHYQSAQCLYQHQHTMDADHLYGLSAECVLKAIMIQFNVTKLDESGNLKKKYKKHINDLWGEYNTALQGRNQATGLLADENPFSDWQISHRYAENDVISADAVARHQQATHKLFELMEQAGQSGA